MQWTLHRLAVARRRDGLDCCRSKNGIVCNGDADPIMRMVNLAVIVA
jgi:hypothetical protein